MAKEREEWQFMEEGQWQTADRRFTILESQSGEYHHLVDNQKLRNSKTFKTFAECDEYAWQIRSGAAETPAGKSQNHRRYEDESAERVPKQNSRGSDAGRGRRNAERTERREAEPGAGRPGVKGNPQENGRSKGNHAANAGSRETANTARTAEKPSRRKRHHHRGNAAQAQNQN